MIVKATSAKRSGSGRLIAASVVMLALAGGGFWKWDQDRQRKIRAEVSALSDAGLIRLHDQQWEQAREIFQKIEALQPGSEVAANGLREVEAALQREKLAFLDRWHTAADKAFAAKQWNEAESAAKSLLARYPDDAEALETLRKVTAIRREETISQHLTDGRNKLQARDWNGGLAATDAALALDGAHAEAKALRDEIVTAQKQAEADRLKARSLFEQAKAADQGKYDKSLLESLKEANALAPEDAEIKALFDKVSTYVRIVRVPGDFATPSEALADLDDGNILELGTGSWLGPLIINKRIELRLLGTSTPVLVCPAGESAAISFGPGASGSKVTGLIFLHSNTGTDTSSERFSAALVRGSEVSFQNCLFSQAAGHGLMVIEGGKVSVKDSKFSGNGWDGAAASGQGSSLEVRNSEASDNGEHGFDVWNGAAGNFSGNRCVNNGRNGIQIDAGASQAIAVNNHLQGNREFGLVIQSGAQGRVAENTFEANQLGGLVVRLLAAKVEISKNRFSGSAPAIVVEKGFALETLGKTNELPPNSPVQSVEFTPATNP